MATDNQQTESELGTVLIGYSFCTATHTQIVLVERVNRVRVKQWRAALNHNRREGTPSTTYRCAERNYTRFRVDAVLVMTTPALVSVAQGHRAGIIRKPGQILYTPRGHFCEKHSNPLKCLCARVCVRVFSSCSAGN